MAGKRRKHDWYPTGGWMTEQLLQRVPQIGGKLLEPCAGDHAITQYLIDLPTMTAIKTNDVDPERQTDFHFDARLPDLYLTDTYDWIITNPPFNAGIEILQQAYEHSVKGCAFLLRLSFLEPTHDRGPWLAEHPPTYQLTLPRYSFTGDGHTDSVTCAWFVWEKGNPVQINQVIPRPEKKAA